MLHRAEGRQAEQRVEPHVDAAEADAETVPNRDQSGLTLRTFFRSLPISLPRHAGLVARPARRCARPAAMAAATCSAASMPDSMALCEPLMRGTLTKPAEQPISAPPGKHELRHRLPAALGDGAGAIGNALAAFEGRRDRRMGLEALELLERRTDTGSCSSDGRRSRPTPDCRRDGRGTSRRRSSCRAASRRSAARGPAGASPARPPRAP